MKRNTQFILSRRYKKLQYLANEMAHVVRSSDELGRFVAQPKLARLRLMVKKEENLTLRRNLEKIFGACSHLSIPRIFIGEREFVGADNIRSDHWPAVWDLPTLLNAHRDKDGLIGDCGNSDQQQVSGLSSFLSESIFGRAFDVNTGNEIAINDFKKNMVVGRSV